MDNIKFWGHIQLIKNKYEGGVRWGKLTWGLVNVIYIYIWVHLLLQTLVGFKLSQTIISHEVQGAWAHVKNIAFVFLPFTFKLEHGGEARPAIK